jgi:metal-responsive CopG/Arc/MetJ family transcriptional regulator
VLDLAYISLYNHRVGKTTRTPWLIHVDPEVAKLVDELAEETGIIRSKLLRRAVDDLLVKYKKMKPRRPKPK